MEKRGIPAVLIGTEPFTSVLEASAKLGGIPGARWATVPHPLQSAPAEVLRGRARSAVEQFVDIVVARSEA